MLRELIAQNQEEWAGSAKGQGDGRFKNIGTAPGTDKYVFGDMLMAGGGEAVDKMARRYEQMNITDVRRGGPPGGRGAPGAGRDGGGLHKL